MLAALLEFDEATFEHSLRVFSTIREKLTGNTPVGIYLRDRMYDEGVATEDLLLAALFHDIGKTALPSEVLHNSLSRREWARLANHHAITEGTEPPYSAEFLETMDDEQLDDYFRIHGNPIDKVPALDAFSRHELDVLSEHGIDISQSFLKILALHERATRVILAGAGMETVATLAGNHHGYSFQPETPTTSSVSALRTGYLETVLRSADILDALIAADREYRKSCSRLQALVCLIGFAERGHLERELTRLWIADEMEKLTELGANSTDGEETRARVKRFLISDYET
jgi:hypothetical protein